jgi:hypothetical protein
VTNTSVNLARSTAVALFAGGWRSSSCGCSVAPIGRDIGAGIYVHREERA